LNDSKHSPNTQREKFLHNFVAHPEIKRGVPSLYAATIDRINILAMPYASGDERGAAQS